MSVCVVCLHTVRGPVIDWRPVQGVSYPRHVSPGTGLMDDLWMQIELRVRAGRQRIISTVFFFFTTTQPNMCTECGLFKPFSFSFSTDETAGVHRVRSSLDDHKLDVAVLKANEHDSLKNRPTKKSSCPWVSSHKLWSGGLHLKFLSVTFFFIPILLNPSPK